MLPGTHCSKNAMGARLRSSRDERRLKMSGPGKSYPRSWDGLFPFTLEPKMDSCILRLSVRSKGSRQ